MSPAENRSARGARANGISRATSPDAGKHPANATRPRLATNADASLHVDVGLLLPPPGTLTPNAFGAATSSAASPGSARARAENAALVERLVTSLRVGKVGATAHEARIRIVPTAAHLPSATPDSIEVRLRVDGHELHATVHADSANLGEGDELLARIRTELTRRGIEASELSLEHL